AINRQAKFYKGDIRDKNFLNNVFEQEKIDGVFHFAANSIVGESMKEPLLYFNNNVYGMQILLEVMKEHNVKHIIFSSTAATYGEPKVVPITEEMQTNPTNTYGETKLIMEKMMKWCDKAYDMKYVALRYFNVAGAQEDGTIGEDHNPETHLIPIVLQAALGKREFITIFGNDYDTEDGTCVRDYVHVVDLVEAHILAMRYLEGGNQSSVFNLGSSEGFSVKQIVECARKITGIDIKEQIGERRAGDPSKLIASSKKARKILGWNPIRTNIENIIKDAWRWHENNIDGYEYK
ncbi:MAG: UDP-glucose 4-epimerase GalE, partial [Clostridium butyricum]